MSVCILITFDNHTPRLFNHTILLHIYAYTLFALLFVCIHKNASLTFAHYRLYTSFSFIHALHSYTQNLSSCRIITHTFHTLYSHLIGIHVLCRFIHILSLTHIHNSIHSCNGLTHIHITIIRMKVIFINVFYALTIYFYPYTPFGCSY